HLRLLSSGLCHSEPQAAARGREGPSGAVRGRNRAAIQGLNLSHVAATTYDNSGSHLPDTPYSRLRRPPFRVSETFHPSTPNPRPPLSSLFIGGISRRLSAFLKGRGHETRSCSRDPAAPHTFGADQYANLDHYAKTFDP